MIRLNSSMMVIAVCLLLSVGVNGQTQKVAEPNSPATTSTLGATASATPEAIVPRLMKFSGVVQDATGKPLSGAVEVTFALYATEAGGDALWFETQSVQADTQGRYTILLGAMHADGLPVDLFTSGEARWLGVQVGRDAEQKPRVLLLSVPYALKAADADTLGGKPASAFMLSDAQTAATTTSASSSSTTTTSTTSGTIKGQQTNG